MSEKRILLASLLKPVNDTRMYEKLGLSLSKLDSVQVHIAGYTAPIPSHAPDNIIFHPVFNFKRLSLGRAKAQLDYWQLLHQVKPDLLIVGTHELLMTSALYARLYSCKLIYDIRENYALNLLTQQHYGYGLRQLLAGGVKFSERLAATVTDHFLLAERSYAQELTFLRKRYTIIENKFKPGKNYSSPATPIKLNGNSLRLLYTGTIARLYGIFEAIELTDKLYKENARVSLTIIGYCASNETLLQLRKIIHSKPHITLVGGDRLVPHQQILEAITNSDVALMPYHYNESTYNCIPTKLYEYTAFGLPVLIQNNPLWDNLVSTYDAGLSIDYRDLYISSLIPTLLKKEFYRNGIPEDVFWVSEEQKLMQIMADLL